MIYLIIKLLLAWTLLSIGAGIAWCVIIGLSDWWHGDDRTIVEMKRDAWDS